MSAFKYDQNVVDGVEVSEVWGLLHNVPDDRRSAVYTEWMQRHHHRAKAQGFGNTELITDPEDDGHLVFKASP